MLQRLSMKCMAGAFALALTVTGAAQVQGATYTPIASPGSEDSHLEIFAHVYGGTWSKVGLSYESDAGIVASRVSDLDDQIWSPNLYGARAEAVFASLDQSFGYLPGTSGGDYVNLFSVSGSGYAVSGSAGHIDLTDTEFRWARYGTRNGVFSSQDSDNPFGLDHMITYAISGPGTAAAGEWMLFFEDVQWGDSDLDYNDLVVRVTIVPTPAAVVPGLLMLGAIGLTRRRRAVA